MRLPEKRPILGIRNERGQSMVEYVLLLLVVVAIVGIAGAKLFKPAAKWMDFYMGDYTYCLLDSGELPQFAGGNPGDCEKLAEQNGFGSSGKDKEAGGAGKENQNSESSTNASNSSAAEAAAARARANSRGRLVKRGGSAFRTSNGQSGRGAADSSEDGEEDGRGKRTRILGGANIVQVRRQQRVNSTYVAELFEKEKKKAKKREEKVSLPLVMDSSSSTAPPRLALKPPTRRSANDDTNIDGSGFNFGSLIRIIIIVAVIVVVIFVIGSQLNTISKSMEK
jgi:hypothetical protein